MKLRRVTWAATAAAALAGISMLPAVAGAQPTSSSTTALAGTAAPPQALAHPAGSVDPNSTLAFSLTLAPRDAAQAQALAYAVSTPGNAEFHHYLTAAQWEARFSPTAAQVTAAQHWLSREGFRLLSVSGDRMTVSASGTAAQVEKAFNTTLGEYSVDGHTLRKANSTLSVPSSLSFVSGVIGVNQQYAAPSVDTGGTPVTASGTAPSGEYPPPPAAFVVAPPCGAYYGQETTSTTFGHGYPNPLPDAVCGYVPSQMRSAYNVGTKYNGAGETVAIVDAYDSATIAQDATRYFAKNDPSNPFSNAHFTRTDSLPFDQEAVCGASGWLEEQALDVEAVHATAPMAHIAYFGAQDCLNNSPYGLYSADQNIIDNGLANVITNSWSDTAGDIFDDVASKTAFDNVLAMAATTGITVQFSSGDDGDNFQLVGISVADYPTSSPLVTAVGGTSLEVGANGQRLGEPGWSTGRSVECTHNIVGVYPGCTKAALGTWLPVGKTSGSGGFTSYYYAEPSYQTNVVPSALADRNANVTGGPARVVPDISMDADPSTGFLIGLHETFPDGSVRYGEFRLGGTSLASPLLAGVVADTDQAAGKALGFLNPSLYGVEGVKGAIYDVVPSGKQALYRRDYAALAGLPVQGYLTSIRILDYQGTEVYCDDTGNCETRPGTQTTAPGYDSMTGLGTPGANFVTDLAAIARNSGS